jgi:hypothetical protein
VRRQHCADESPLRAVVAIPARDEADRIQACLQALADQVDARGRELEPGAYGVLLLLNNCSDGSADVARQTAKHYPVPLRVVEKTLPHRLAHAGGARRAAMDLAAHWLTETPGIDQKVLLTTDADTKPRPDWIAANFKAFDTGADAVAGIFALDPEDETRLPKALRARGRQEAAYADLLIEMAALLDPQPWNPYPHHATASGASLAVTLSAYRQIGGLPAASVGEDKALVAALCMRDARVRFDPNVQVITSGRLVGRARGGAADTLRLRSEDPLAHCDEALEPAGAAFARAKWRGRLRRRHGRRHNAVVGNRFDTGSHRAFGAAWSEIERTHPLFLRRLLTPADLTLQIKLAGAAVRRLRALLAPPDQIETELFGALLPDDIRELADTG